MIHVTKESIAIVYIVCDICINSFSLSAVFLKLNCKKIKQTHTNNKRTKEQKKNGFEGFSFGCWW